MRTTFHENNLVGPALLPASVADGGTVNGPRIVFPGQKGDMITFLLTAPALTGLTAFKCRVEGSNDNGATWAPLKQNDGTTDLAFTGAKFIAAGAYASKVAIGSFPLWRNKYRDLRLAITSNTGAAAVWAASYIVTQVKRRPVGEEYPGGVNAYGQTTSDVTNAQTDEFLNAFLPTGS